MGGMATRNVLPIDHAAARIRARLQGRHLRVSAHGVVHRTRPVRWLRGETIPGPRCGTPTGVIDPGNWEATDEDVTCLHCLRSTVTETDTSAEQLALFDAA